MKSLYVALLVFLPLQISKSLDFTCCDGEVRLFRGSVLNEGRTEICLSGQWKSVCDNSWSDREAQVVCKQLGYPHQGVVPLTEINYGQESSSTVEYIECDGTEKSLIGCTIRDVPDGHCTHSGVQCACRNGDVRLEGSTVQGSGRVEVCVDNVWGTVCDDSWTELNAIVVCKQLGFSLFGAHPECCARYGQGSGPIHLNDIQCTGAESSLINCSHSTRHTCSHNNDVAVQCQASPPCYNGDVRLVDGRHPHEGRVEICLNETWGTICDYISIYGWNVTEAEVVCKQLGYSGANSSTHNYGSGNVSVIIMNPHCRGTEPSLAECVYTISQNIICSRNEHDIIGVQCIPDAVKNSKLRLTDGLTGYEGRVEIYWNSQWRTICNDGWDKLDAIVVCRQLNYLSTSVQVKAITYGQGYKGNPMLLANIGCTGSENNITNCCATRIPDNSQCHSRLYAGVRCAQCIENSIQLIGELSQNEGFVVICLGGSWGKVCGGNTQAAQVVCRQLGFSNKDPFVYNYPCLFDVVSAALPFLMENVQCTSHETQLSQCNHEDSGIAFCDNIFGMKCQLTEQNTPGAPANIQTSSVTSSSIGLTWSPPLVSEILGLTIYSYAVACSIGSPMNDNTVKISDTRSATFSQLHPFTQYNCCVAVNSNNGRGKLACLNAITAAIDTGVDYPASTTALAIFFVIVSIALIAVMTVLVYLHYKQCITYIKRIIKYDKPGQIQNPEHDLENPAYEFVDTPSESTTGSKLENFPYQVTVLGALKDTRSVPPAEYLTPRNMELIKCEECNEHGNSTGVCTHRRDPYQSLILMESSCQAAYQDLLQDTLTKSPTNPSSGKKREISRKGDADKQGLRE